VDPARRHGAGARERRAGGGRRQPPADGRLVGHRHPRALSAVRGLPAVPARTGARAGRPRPLLRQQDAARLAREPQRSAAGGGRGGDRAACDGLDDRYPVIEEFEDRSTLTLADVVAVLGSGDPDGATPPTPSR
jgi:hypothetical protein